MWTKHVLQVDVGALRAERTEAQQIISAQGLSLIQIGTMLKLACIRKLAKASFVVRTRFSLLVIAAHQTARLRIRMPVDTLVLFRANTVLLKEPTDRNFLFIVNVEVVTIVAPDTLLLDPVHAH